MREPLPGTPAYLAELALASGFTRTAELKTETIRVRPEVRESCAAGKCGAYGKNWSCPPACGALEECEKQIRQYRSGLLLQTSGSLEDAFDYEGMTRIGAEHNLHLQALREKLLPGTPFLLLGSGACKNCDPCACPASPCPFPQKMIVSMEAMGILVSELSAANNLPYYYGPNTLSYVGCVLIGKSGPP